MRGSLQQRIHHCIAALQLQQQHARLRGAIHRLGPSAHVRDDVYEDTRRVRPGVVLVRDGEERVESTGQSSALALASPAAFLAHSPAGWGAGKVKGSSLLKIGCPGVTSALISRTTARRARGPALAAPPKAFKHALDAISARAFTETHSRSNARLPERVLEPVVHGSWPHPPAVWPVVGPHGRRAVRARISPVPLSARVNESLGPVVLSGSRFARTSLCHREGEDFQTPNGKTEVK